MRRRILLTAYAAPASMLVAFFFAIPLLAMIWLSFFEQRGFTIGTEVTLSNYETFFSRPYYLQALSNSITLAALVTAVSALVAYPFAYVMAFYLSPTWQRIAIVACILPFWTSYLVRSYSWLLALSGNGIVAQVGNAIGLSAGTGLANTNAATVIGFVHFFVMLLILTIFSSLARIPRTYLRAAADLGANSYNRFLRITLPLSLPGTVAGCLLTFVLAIGDYVTPQILGGGKQLVLTQVIMLQVQREGNFSMAAAISLILMVISIGITIIAGAAVSRAKT